MTNLQQLIAAATDAGLDGLTLYKSASGGDWQASTRWGGPGWVVRQGRSPAEALASALDTSGPRVSPPAAPAGSVFE